MENSIDKTKKINYFKINLINNKNNNVFFQYFENNGEDFLLILLFFLPFFLLANKFPYLAIINIILIFLLNLIAFFDKKYINSYNFSILVILIIIYFYFVISYFISGQKLSNFFSYDFLRYDGGFFFCYLPFFIFLVPFFSYKKVLLFFSHILFFVFSLFAVIGFFEFLSGNYFLMIRVDDIYVGPMFIALNNSHNATGAVYCIVCIFLLAFFLLSDKYLKIAYGGMLIINFIALFLTKSRGSLIGFIVGSVFVIIILSKSIIRFLKNIIILIVVLIPIVFFTNTFGRIMEIFRRTDLNSLTRLVLWDRALYLFKQSPIIGIGFARFNDVIWHYNTVPLVGKPNFISLFTEPVFIFHSGDAHNTYLQYLAETGILGLSLVMFFWVFCLFLFLYNFKKTKDIFSRMVYLSCVGGIFSLFFLSITQNYFANPTVMTCFTTFCALAVGLTWENNLAENNFVKSLGGENC